MKLHEWQKLALSKVVAALKIHHRVLAVGPTACGKTVIAAAIITTFFLKGRVLWVAHRRELIQQAIRELIAAGVPKKDIGTRVIVTSVQSLARRDVPEVDLIVIDEAHRSAAKTYRRLIETGAPVLGLTATPWRLDGQPLGDLFNELVVMAESTALEADGYIAAPVTYGVSKKAAREMVRGASGGTDFNVEKVARSMSSRRLMGDVVSECRRLAPDAKTLVFAVNRKHGKKLEAEFKRDGRAVEYLDGETSPKTRDAMLARLADGATEVIVNVDVLSEGYDCPAVKCIAIARPTKSLTRFLQYCGRGVRIYENQRPVILDHGGNCWRHGLPNAERSELWTLDGDQSAASKAMPITHCENCGALVTVGTPACPECGSSLRTSADQETGAEDLALERLKFEQAELARKRQVLLQLGAARQLEGRVQDVEAWAARWLASIANGVRHAASV